MRAEPGVPKSGSPAAAAPLACRRNPRSASQLRARPGHGSGPDARPWSGPYLQINRDRKKPGTSLSRTGPGSGSGWGPRRPAGRPGKPKGGVMGSAELAEGGRGRAEEKKTWNSLRLNRTRQQHREKVHGYDIQELKLINEGGHQQTTKDGGMPADRTWRSLSLKDMARPPGWSLVPGGGPAPTSTSSRSHPPSRPSESMAAAALAAAAAVHLLLLHLQAAATSFSRRAPPSAAPRDHRSPREKQPRGLHPPDWTGGPRSPESEGPAKATRRRWDRPCIRTN